MSAPAETRPAIEESLRLASGLVLLLEQLGMVGEAIAVDEVRSKLQSTLEWRKARGE